MLNRTIVVIIEWFHDDFDLLLKVNDCVKITYTGLGRGKNSV